MRMSKQAMAQHHGVIVARASELLRARGLAGPSVAELMAAAGLTHGGFYRHFDSREDLVIAAVAAAFAQMIARIRGLEAQVGRGAALGGFLDHYLSSAHLNDAAQGCPMAALAGDIARESQAVRQAYDAEVAGLFAVLGGLLPEGVTVTPATVMAVLAGAVVIARGIADTDHAAIILRDARQTLAALLG